MSICWQDSGASLAEGFCALENIDRFVGWSAWHKRLVMQTLHFRLQAKMKANLYSLDD